MLVKNGRVERIVLDRERECILVGGKVLEVSGTS